MMEQNISSNAAQEPLQTQTTTCCIVGGGPAGVLLAYMLARKGVDVTLVESHLTFDRDFRGDTIHPACLDILDSLGLAEKLFELPYDKARFLSAEIDGQDVTLVDFQILHVPFPYILIVPQIDFLNFLVEEAKHFPHFHLLMGARAESLLEKNGMVQGIRYEGKNGWGEIRASLTVGADGRFSRLRKLTNFPAITSSPPMDVLWFRLPRHANETLDGAMGRVDMGKIFIVLPRSDHWQLGYVIPKGGYQEIRKQGIETMRALVMRMMPDFADRAELLHEWKQFSVLSVASDRLTRWYNPGLLLIGDAAHVMSPVGGVGINYAIQDAVEAANILGDKLKYGIVHERDLARVQRKRELPVRLIQRVQTEIQNRLLAPTLNGSKKITVPVLLRFLFKIPAIRKIMARIIAYGLWPARVKK